MEHETNIHNRSKDLSAQTVEGKIAFGGERVKTNGQAAGEGWLPYQRDRDHNRQVGSFLF